MISPVDSRRKIVICLVITQEKWIIGSLDNSEKKWSLFEYWQNSKELSDYRGQKFLDDLIENNYM